MTEHPIHLDGWLAQRLLLEGPPPARPDRPRVRTILDCGAHVGWARNHYRRVFPGATIHCLEPNPETFETLRAAVEDDEHTHAWPLGVSDRAGAATLHLADHDYADSLVRRCENDPGGRRGRAVEVELVDLDGFCAERGIEHVDVLKLDVEGVEIEALRGAASLFARRAIDLIFCELNPKPSHPGQSRADEVIALLWDRDFRLFDLYHPNYLEPRKGVALLDGLFLPRELHPAFHDRAVPLAAPATVDGR